MESIFSTGMKRRNNDLLLKQIIPTAGSEKKTGESEDLHSTYKNKVGQPQLMLTSLHFTSSNLSANEISLAMGLSNQRAKRKDH